MFQGSEKLKTVLEYRSEQAPITFETGWVAKQASGSVIVRQGDTMVLVTVCGAEARQEQDFFPLVVEYQERLYAAGKIPGGFFKREGKPMESEILTCRLVDRPIRPMFPEGYVDEVQIICTVLSADGVHSPDVLAICGASTALHISELPFMGPLAGVRVGRIDGKFVCNPTKQQAEKTDLEFIVAGSKDAIVMVEGGAASIPEAVVLDALFTAHEEIKKICEIQEQLRQKVGKAKKEVVLKKHDQEIEKIVTEMVNAKIAASLEIKNKHERKDAYKAVKEEVLTALAEKFPERQKEIVKVLEDIHYSANRRLIVDKNTRLDGRKLTDVRQIECEVGILPRTHGSALFTRGETQAIVTTTLGTLSDAQKIDGLGDTQDKKFILHYNFPPYSTGEVKMLRGTGRREIGHGNLAERALRYVAPAESKFPYVIRIVSDITESNGSSSMASVCGGTLSMMDAGVPIKHPVAGVAMGLIKEEDKVAILTDILGDEDHFGDMDFKVCGTAEGITALQMDIKCTGLSKEIMSTALEQARVARLHILDCMLKTLDTPRDGLSQFAPQVTSFKINPDKIRDLIGPGGKMIKSIVEKTGAKIDVTDDGTVSVSSSDPEKLRAAIDMVKTVTAEAEIGKIYTGNVKRVTDFGAFVEIIPGIEGLVHISQLDFSRVENVTDIVKEGDEIPVKVLEIDKQGRIRLSRKEALTEIDI